MKIKEYALYKVKETKIGTQFIEDNRYKLSVKAVISLTFNLAYAFYNGLLGAISSSFIFIASFFYYLLLSIMRFSVIVFQKGKGGVSEAKITSAIGFMLIILSIVFHIMVLISIKQKTADIYGTVTMITIATFTFTKITTAAVTAVRNRKSNSVLIKAINSIRYSEVAVSLLIMQQSMLVSFGAKDTATSLVLNACTGAGVCLFILILGIITILNSRKGDNSGEIKIS